MSGKQGHEVVRGEGPDGRGGGKAMDAEWREVRIILVCLFLWVLFPVPAHAQADPQGLRRQACEQVFEIITQCQLSAGSTEQSCDEISGALTSPQTKEMLSQSKPDIATDVLVEQTVTQVADMCRDACERARDGRLYKTAREWMDAGGCTIQVTP